jgi:hypothetical protein
MVVLATWGASSRHLSLVQVPRRWAGLLVGTTEAPGEYFYHDGKMGQVLPLLVGDKSMLAALWTINENDYIFKYNLFIKKFNTFQADTSIQQIEIINPSASITASQFKWRSARGTFEIWMSSIPRP